MKHPTEKELIVYREREGSAAERQRVAAHLAGCAACREELERLEDMLRALSEIAVPDPGPDYGQRVWQQISARLPEKRSGWWGFLARGGWLEPQRLAAAGAVAALVVAAYLVGHQTRPGPSVTAPPQSVEQVRERVLIVAVGQHLGKSEMMLMELENAPRPAGGGPLINISAEQRRAEDLVEENRLYRQTAVKEGDKRMASTLDELERVLLDVANSPGEVTPAQFEKMRQRIESRGILFKVRVVSKELRDRQKAGRPAPAQDGSKTRGRNKV